MSERQSLEERLSRAINSRDLSADGPEQRQDSDYLGALGFATRRHASTLRLQLSGSQADYREAKSEAQWTALNMNFRRRWGLSPKNASRVGELALAHHVFPVCRSCKGVKFEVPEGSPYPSSSICQPCQGTGLEPIQFKWCRQIQEVMVELQQAETRTARALGGYLG